MKIDVENKNKGAILRLDGKVIGDGVPKFKRTIEDQINSGIKWLIIDLADVPLMDSSALGTMVMAFLKLKEKEGKLILLNVQKNIQDVLGITKLNSLFEISDNMQNALELTGANVA